jgi:pimeloyl-ACP methyl ester carboxylesterase
MNRRNFLSAGSASAAFALLPAAKVTAAAVAYTPCSQLSELPAPPSPDTTRKLFPGFVAETVKTSGAGINVLKGGDGPPLLLIHGHPETHVTWHKVAADLARSYTVIVPDLRATAIPASPTVESVRSTTRFEPWPRIRWRPCVNSAMSGSL